MPAFMKVITGAHRHKLYIRHVYFGENNKCSALVTTNNKIRLLGHKVKIMIIISIDDIDISDLWGGRLTYRYKLKTMYKYK